ncbi:MAG: T9SS type A sorting domain-containing protein [Flavobacteriales bacterium]|nr:T9SS type A sorting domain-containing protein [Flavobacteriales bacterium]
MKHLLSPIALLLAGAINAQDQGPVLRNERLPFTNIGTHEVHDDPRDADVVLWSEDFESGMNGWTVSTMAGGVSWQLTSTGNTGGYTPGPLQSTTGHPGGSWIVADSDQQGAPGVVENTSITSPPITGLDGTAFMLLRFQQSFRQLNDDETTVEVSGDGGANWTVYPVNTDIPGNQSTPGAPAAQAVTLNVSSALTNGSADIRIRFRWYSSEGYTYSWQVDDVVLVAAKQNDLALSRTTWSAWYLGQPDYRDLPYTVYPQNQLRPLNLRGIIANNGSTTQHNVRLQVSVDGPGSNDATLTSNAITLAPMATDSLFITTYEPPAVAGTFTLTFTVLQDEVEQDSSDNTAGHAFAIDPFVFARDLGALDGETAKGNEEYILGNWFHNDGAGNVLTGVQVALSDRSDPGALITVAVYDENLNQLDESEEHLVTAAELNGDGEGEFITIPLSSPVNLAHNHAYLVAVHHYGGSLEVWTGTSGISPEQTSLIYDGGQGQWFYTRSTPMVRMTFDPTAGLAPLEQATAWGLAALPSVFDDASVLRFTVQEASPFRLTVTDATGRVMQERSLGRLPTGENRITVDGQGLAPGTYLATLSNGSQQAVVRLVRTGVH